MSDSHRGRHRRATVVLDIILLLVILAVLAFVLVPSYERSTSLREMRACYAIQRKLLAAVEAYEADTGQSVGELTAFLPRLVEKGYLPEVPQDPGDDGTSSFTHYGQSLNGTIYCWVHGSPWSCGPRPIPSPLPVASPGQTQADDRADGRSSRTIPTATSSSAPKRFPGLWR